ncbi:protein CURVATURE THYLAKOID 1D, chloroplastic-like isoform X2 [Rhododendron vialii]|uniref:protein CURVATURE THYLAKOID 1D, chloroplastic-like isoform X2 n=1 Tax=Rhododendron vialii TaxID=182163 RepID=UPI00265DE880|nr:protein CURVATURE THYLAKOID 1D, chloroplastic-like isoform X2 [Rhododendron vialii]
MEICTSRTISNVPHHMLLTLNNTHLLRRKSSLSLKQPSISRTNPGLLYCSHSSLRSTTSEETSSGASQYVREKPGLVTTEDVQPGEMNAYAEMAPEDVPTENSLLDGQVQASQFLDKLDIKLDSDDTFSVLLFGGGALVSLWIATLVVSAIDSIPVFPKFLEVVGLGYTVWFSTRYLIFKKNREELVAKIEEIKQQVLGSNDD